MAQPSFPPPHASFPPPLTSYPPPAAPPVRPRSTRMRWLAGAAVAILVLSIVAGFLNAARMTPASNRASAAPTVSVAATATASIGAATAFAGKDGSGQVTVSSAAWSTTGDTMPPTGQAFLVVDLTVSATVGRVEAGWIYVRLVDAAGETHLFSLGPKLSHLLHSQVLTPGQSATGQVSFTAPRGACVLQFLDPGLGPVASIRIPA